MKYNHLLLPAIIFLFFSCDKKTSYNPDDHLTAAKKDEVMTKVIRYLAKPPENTTEEEKFDKAYDGYYLDKMSRAKLEFYYPADGGAYFLVSLPAPSLYEKRHATGGKFKLNDKGELTEYEEIFRTWKMMPDTLVRRSGMLFDRMVKGESLEPYWTKNSNGEEYIEFPDPHVYYEKTERKWKTKF
ncbi:MAG TPA: hypothetical protein VIU12_11910 [Chryseolinea sp.]